MFLNRLLAEILHKRFLLLGQACGAIENPEQSTEGYDLMNDKQVMGLNKGSLQMTVLLAAMLAVGVLFTWWIVHRTDRAMRDDLLQQARLVMKAVNLDRLQALTGTAADLNTPGYLRLKEQLAAVKKANTQCRFAYLMGRRPDGRVFFFVDNEPVGSQNESPAGQIYEEISPEYLRVFDEKISLTVGPVADRWGIWITALVPMAAPASGDLISVLGMDIDARTWNWDLAVRIALPVGLLFILLICAGVVLLSSVRSVDVSPKPVLRRLLPPLVGMVLLLTFGTGSFEWHQYQRLHAATITKHLSEISGDLDSALEGDAAGLATALQPIVANERMRSALLSGDTDRLLADWHPVFDAMHRENCITHFYFFDLTRTCLLRVHKPEKHGDLINRFTALEAERTGKVASGIELGPLGTFTLRVVQPVFQDNRLLGYVELGKEIEDVLKDLHVRSGSHLAVAIRKEYLDRETWENGMKFLGRIADWDRLPGDVIIYSSQSRLPDVFASMATHSLDGGHFHGEVTHFKLDGRDWSLSAIPIHDVSGKEVGDLLAMLDVTVEEAAFVRLLVLGGAGHGILLALLVGFVFVLLLRTDRAITLQRTELQESEDRHRAMFQKNKSVQLLIDPRNGAIADANSAACVFYGYTLEQMCQMKISDINTLSPDKVAKEMEAALIEHGQHFEFKHRLAGGQIRDVQVSSSPIFSSQRQWLYSIVHDITDLKRVEEQLRENESVQRILLENINAGVVIIDAVTHVIEQVNKKGVELFGGAEAQIVGNICHCFLCPEENGCCPVTDMGKDVNNSDRILLRADGSHLPILKSVRHIQISGKNKLLETFIDINDRKQMEDSLRENQDRLDLALQSALMGAWHWDIVEDKRYFDAKVCHLLGIDPESFYGTAEEFLSTVHPDDRDMLKEAMARTIDHDLPYKPEYRAVWQDGSIHYIAAHGRLFRGDSGQPVKIIGLIADITENKLAQQNFENERQRLANVIQGTHAGTWEWNVQTGETAFNEKWAEIFGYTLEELTPVSIRTWTSFAHPEDLKESGKLLEKHFSGELPYYDCQCRMKHKNGHWVWVHDRGQVITRTEDGKPEMMFGTHIDISKAKQAEKALLETNLQLEEATAMANHMAGEAEMANAAKSEFLANMSHEIRTPMNGVIGMTGLLLDTALTGEQRHYAETVRASGESLLGLINDILDFSKIEAGKMDLEVLDFNLQSLLDDFTSTLALQAHEKGLELACGMSSDAPALLRGDPGRLRQILTNLAGNAVKFTTEGEVSIRVMLDSDAEKAAVLRFAVRDTGIGIPSDKIGLLFNKFSQVDASTTRMFGGTGLGLAICKELAGMMGGEIGVTSKEGRGSEFWFTACFEKQPEAQTANLDVPADLQGVRALIVDDNATSREILTTRMASWGMRVSEAGNGPGALQCLHQAADENDHFQVAVIDMQMPGMDGAELGRAIRMASRLPETRLVLLSSLGVRGDAKRFAEIGYNAYLTKPARTLELKAVLSRVLMSPGDRPLQSSVITTRHTAREAMNRFAGRKGRILLAEDNITNQQVALGILKKLGLKADAVANGAEAVKALETIPYDLVLMDVQMPIMDGLEATMQIRDLQSTVENHDVPIIAMTAHVMAGDREKCLEAGMNGYVSKPVDPLSLAMELERWLAKEPVNDVDFDKAGGRSMIPPSERDDLSETENAHIQKEESESAISVFDRDTFLDRLMGDEDLATTVIIGFLDDIPKQIERLKRLVDEGSAVEAGGQAHKIKGAAANVTGQALQEIANLIETAGKSDKLEKVANLIPELENRYAQLKKAMESEH
jgi:PAS domain S-box-containing protein